MLSRRCQSCGATIAGRRDRTTCSDACRKRLHRSRSDDAWRLAIVQLEVEAPERWGRAAPRIVTREVDLDDELLGTLWDAP
jgi:hypothetical protein